MMLTPIHYAGNPGIYKICTIYLLQKTEQTLSRNILDTPKLFSLSITSYRSEEASR